MSEAHEIDREQLRVVLEDLDYLESQWDRDVTDASLRISSPILHRLLVEGHLERAAHAMGMKIRIMAPVASKEILNEGPNRPKVWQAGGGASGLAGMIGGFRFYDGAVPIEEIKNRKHISPDKKYPERLGKYLRLPSYIINDEVIRVEEVVKYVTDKKGGRHYDPSRSRKPLDKKYELLDGVASQVQLAGKGSVFLELVSIGQFVINSRDVQKLRKAIRRHLGM